MSVYIAANNIGFYAMFAQRYDLKLVLLIDIIKRYGIFDLHTGANIV
jgi:hypothetical protein